MNPLKYPIRRISPLLLTMGLCACEDPNLPIDDRNKTMNGNFFPMIPESTWTFVTESTYQWPDTSRISFDTVTYIVKGDKAWLENYEPISQVQADWTGTVRWIKVEGPKYFTMAAYDPEYMFLDTGMPLYARWSYSDSFGMRLFAINATHATKTVKGVTYHHVIEVLETTFFWNSTLNAYEESNRSFHYYAKGVGEIYTYYPDTGWRYVRGDIKVSLISYTRP